MTAKLPFFLFLLFLNPLFAFSTLSVSPSISTLGCNTSNVSFSFNCSFNGNVLVTSSSGTGISFPGYPPGGSIFTVTNGSLDIEINIQSNAPQNFNISFFVLASDEPCASFQDVASASLTHTCILPINDECSNALALGVSINTCSYTSFSTANATASGNVPSGGGAGYNDLWYSFQAINDTVTMEFDSFPGNVGFYGLYDACPDVGGNEVTSGIIVPFSGVDSIRFVGLTLNSTYILQLFHLPGQSGNPQEICLQAPPVPCPQDIIVSEAGPNTPNTSYSACNSISTSGSTTLSSSGVLYEAPAVILNPGFYSGSGVFEAKATN